MENGSADLDEQRWGRNAVRNDKQLASARFSTRGHIKVCGDLLAPGRECHGAVVMRSAVKDVACGLVHQPDQRIVGCIQEVVSIGGSLRESVKLRARNRITPATC